MSHVPSGVVTNLELGEHLEVFFTAPPLPSITLFSPSPLIIKCIPLDYSFL